MLRLLADEHIPRSTVDMLREMGHDALCVADIKMQGADDAVLYELAVKERYIIVSFDDYFALRAYSAPPRPVGIMTLKFQPRDALDINDLVRDAVSSVEDFVDKHIIVQRTRIHVRPLAL